MRHETLNIMLSLKFTQHWLEPSLYDSYKLSQKFLRKI